MQLPGSLGFLANASPHTKATAACTSLLHLVDVIEIKCVTHGRVSLSIEGSR